MPEPRNVPDALAEELHRRAARLEELRADPTSSPSVRDHLLGELIGLRGALGIALGHHVPGGSADIAGVDYYLKWLAREHPEAPISHTL
jgi:hypothetical protein